MRKPTRLIVALVFFVLFFSGNALAVDCEGDPIDPLDDFMVTPCDMTKSMTLNNNIDLMGGSINIYCAECTLDGQYIFTIESNAGISPYIVVMDGAFVALQGLTLVDNSGGYMATGIQASGNSGIIFIDTITANLNIGLELTDGGMGMSTQVLGELQGYDNQMATLQIQTNYPTTIPSVFANDYDTFALGNEPGMFNGTVIRYDDTYTDCDKTLNTVLEDRGDADHILWLPTSAQNMIIVTDGFFSFDTAGGLGYPYSNKVLTVYDMGTPDLDETALAGGSSPTATTSYVTNRATYDADEGLAPCMDCTNTSYGGGMATTTLPLASPNQSAGFTLLGGGCAPECDGTFSVVPCTIDLDVLGGIFGITDNVDLTGQPGDLITVQGTGTIIGGGYEILVDSSTSNVLLLQPGSDVTIAGGLTINDSSGSDTVIAFRLMGATANITGEGIDLGALVYVDGMAGPSNLKGTLTCTGCAKTLHVYKQEPTAFSDAVVFNGTLTTSTVGGGTPFAVTHEVTADPDRPFTNLAEWEEGTGTPITIDAGNETGIRVFDGGVGIDNFSSPVNASLDGDITLTATATGSISPFNTALTNALANPDASDWPGLTSNAALVAAGSTTDCSTCTYTPGATVTTLNAPSFDSYHTIGINLAVAGTDTTTVIGDASINTVDNSADPVVDFYCTGPCNPTLDVPISPSTTGATAIRMQTGTEINFQGNGQSVSLPAGGVGIYSDGSATWSVDNLSFTGGEHAIEAINPNGGIAAQNITATNLSGPAVSITSTGQEFSDTVSIATVGGVSGFQNISIAGSTPASFFLEWDYGGMTTSWQIDDGTTLHVGTENDVIFGDLWFGFNSANFDASVVNSSGTATIVSNYVDCSQPLIKDNTLGMPSSYQDLLNNKINFTAATELSCVNPASPGTRSWSWGDNDLTNSGTGQGGGSYVAPGLPRLRYDFSNHLTLFADNDWQGQNTGFPQASNDFNTRVKEWSDQNFVFSAGSLNNTRIMSRTFSDELEWNYDDNWMTFYNPTTGIGTASHLFQAPAPLHPLNDGSGKYWIGYTVVDAGLTDYNVWLSRAKSYQKTYTPMWQWTATDLNILGSSIVTVKYNEKAKDIDGNANAFVFVYTSDQLGFQNECYFQMFDNSGNVLVSETLVNSTTANNQDNCKVAMYPNGNFVVAWDGYSEIPPGSGFPLDTQGVYFQIFDNLGNPVGSETIVNLNMIGNQQRSDIDIDLSTNDFIIVWDGDDGLFDSQGVFLSRYSSAGVDLDPLQDLLVNTTTTGFQGWPAVSARSTDGNFIVIWEGRADDPSSGLQIDSDGVYIQRYSWFAPSGIHTQYAPLEEWLSKMTDWISLQWVGTSDLSAETPDVAYINDRYYAVWIDEGPQDILSGIPSRYVAGGRFGFWDAASGKQEPSYNSPAHRTASGNPVFTSAIDDTMPGFARWLVRDSSWRLHTLHKPAVGVMGGWGLLHDVNWAHTRSTDGFFTAWQQPDWVPVQIPGTTAEATDSQKLPNMAITSDDNLHMVWYSNDSPDFNCYYTRSINGGSTWTYPPQQFDTSSMDSCYMPAVAVDSDDNIHIAYGVTSGGGLNNDVYHVVSSDQGNTWSTPLTTMSINASCNGNTQIAIASDDNIYIAAYDCSGLNPQDIFFAFSSNGGLTFNSLNATNLNTITGGLAMTLTPNDDIHILYGDNCGGLPVPSCTLDVIRSSDAGATWTLPTTVATGVAQHYMDIAGSEDGNLHAIYRDIISGGAWYEDTNVYYRMSSDGGNSWSSAQTAYRAAPYTLTTFMASPGIHPYSLDMMWANWPQIGGDRTNVPDNGFLAIIGTRWPYQERYALDIFNWTVWEYYGQMILYNSDLSEVPELSLEQFLLIILVVTLVSVLIRRQYVRKKRIGKR